MQKAEKVNLDFEKLCKKHGLERAVMVFPFDENSTIAAAHIKGGDGKEEARLASLSSKLFSFTGIQPDYIEGVISVIESERSRRAVDAGLKAMMESREKGLSPKDKVKLKKLRKKKEAFVLKGKFEEASKVREEERKLLGINVYDVTNFDRDDLDLVLDIDKAGDIMLQSIKNFRLKVKKASEKKITP